MLNAKVAYIQNTESFKKYSDFVYYFWNHEEILIVIPTYSYISSVKIHKIMTALDFTFLS